MSRVFEKMLKNIDSNDFFKSKRWYQHKQETIRRISLFDAIELGDDVGLALCQLSFAGGGSALYSIPFKSGTDSIDAVTNDGFLNALFKGVEAGSVFRGSKGSMVCKRVGQGRMPSSKGIYYTLLDASSTNSLIDAQSGDGRVVLKLMRRVQAGHNVEADVNAYLATETTFQWSPMLKAVAEYTTDSGERYHIASVFDYVRNKGDGWSYTLSFLRDLMGKNVSVNSAAFAEACIPYRKHLESLANRLAELHMALGGDPSMHVKSKAQGSKSYEGTFAWKNIGENEARAIQTRVRETADKAFAMIEHSGAEMNNLALIHEQRGLIEQFIDEIPDTLMRFDVAARQHGDFHLGQTIMTEDGFIILDFEGEPLRPASEREMAMPLMLDVAGLLRSLNYASYAAFFAYRDGHRNASADELKRVKDLCTAWERRSSEVFTESYVQALKDRSSMPLPFDDASVIVKTLAIFKLEKALYELMYELNNRPDWLDIPVCGIMKLTDELM